MTISPPRTPTAPDDERSLASEAAGILAATLAETNRLSGVRERHRRQLSRAIDLAQGVVNRAHQGGGDSAVVARARLTLAKAFAARAQDAHHGVNQLSQASQRAPTRADCDDGWRKVEGFAQVARASAEEAGHCATQLDTKAAWKAARIAEDAARDARRIVDVRNNAYTFHASPGFSFGEGWYAAAAAMVAGVSVQVEPDQPQTAQAEQFMRDAGLSHRLVPYRSRPRANKQLPEMVAKAFRADASGVQRTLRAAFLGDEPVPRGIAQWCDHQLAGAPAGPKVLLWLRYASYQSHRNTDHPELVQLAKQTIAHGLVPILIGDALQDDAPPGTVDMTLFWQLPIFQGPDMRRAQLQLFEHLKRAHRLVGQIGVTTAGMDGPALMGLPTLYLTQEPNPRMGLWVGAVPGYQEVVRDGAHLERVSQTCKQWADSARFPAN